MNDQTERIVQLIPGTGWNAIYAMENGQEETVPLVAWALLSNGDVKALDTDRNGYIEFPTEVANFVRLETVE